MLIVFNPSGISFYFSDCISVSLRAHKLGNCVPCTIVCAAYKIKKIYVEYADKYYDFMSEMREGLNVFPM